MSALLLTDLDGTLLGPDRSFASEDLETLDALGARGVVRCIATGRNLFSAQQVLPAGMPVDYLIFSSGAGIVDWPARRLLLSRLMDPAMVGRAYEAIRDRGLDLMVHDPVPENHHFAYFAANGRGGDDFRRRIERYRPFARRGDPRSFRPAASTQLLGVAEGGEAGESDYLALRARLNGLTVLRATSPLDGRSTWIEVFHPRVSKAQAAQWVGERHGVGPEDALAVGNDFNDEDMLAWAGRAAVVEGAPESLARRFPVVSRACGLTTAVRGWRLAGRLL